MLHHVALEVRPEKVEAEGDFWLAVGFARVAAPGALGRGFDWYEKGGTQVHLIESADPVVPENGHTAIVAADIDRAVARLEAGGFEVDERRPLWGARRVKSRTPAGHVVEIMAAPPAAAAGGRD